MVSMSSDQQFVLCEAFLIFAVTRFLLSCVLNLLTSSTNNDFSSSYCFSSSSSLSSSSSSSLSSANLRAITKSLCLTTVGNIQHRHQLPGSQDYVISCAVCMNSLRKKSQVWELRNCSHVFHKHCLEKWISYESTCPLCRASLLAADSSFLPPPPPPKQPSSWAVEQMLYLFGDDLLPIDPSHISQV